MLSVSQPYEQKLHAQIQAVHAQSPRTVQRNVDQITSEIKNNCDLRKSINFKLNNEDNSEKLETMDCEQHEPMEQVEEEEFELPTKDINPFDKNLIAGLLKKIKFPQAHHANGYTRIDTNLNKFVPSTMVTLGQYITYFIYSVETLRIRPFVSLPFCLKLRLLIRYCVRRQRSV